MTVSIESVDRLEQVAGLSFLRTVDRTLVHRSAVAEVFVTDMCRIADYQYVAGAQLPLTHGYYNDHVQSTALFDPLLLAEASRQAGICGAHLCGVPRQTAILVNTFSLELANLDALAVGRAPGRLRIDCAFQPLRVRAGKLRRGMVEQQLYVADRRVGQHRMEVQFLSHTEHDALRHAQRGSAAPSTADLADVPHLRQVAPHLVGRAHPLNVVLADPVEVDGQLRALVRPRLGNRAIFDHDYDHLPAMSLAEAARQLALMSVDDGTGAVAARTHLGSVGGDFLRFAELDEPVFAATPRTPAGAPERVAARTVTFTQSGAEIARITLTLVPSSLIGALDD
ncbi:AfsA-related hotdog domain-containing protein [Goodfellowiella coeruleoviolacea]|uniref:A-factor biosynthesis hotdog domain-containing protein n=1 Tax=Goodfellowiella coeruleoviolacea TaxID=334858 RepID=A0AAE3GA72_9PSEU|nr:AfsA-related hotdog domain-containing protein [Goodfellowiella coeruleoviolacea]MCP2164088.1 A-factor biosynthesis hotdog domain-containing protein [Goodfellowiella coeruleoviolacea]